MGEFEKGELKSSSGDKVTKRKQALAIALSMRDSGKLARGGVVTFELRNNDGRYQEVWELDEMDMEDYGYTNLNEVSNKKLIEDYFGNVYFYDEDNVWVDEDVIVENIRREAWEKSKKERTVTHVTHFFAHQAHSI